ncbi:glycosyltransferase involved in cell wall biosynthesis [Gelidibacter algens]|uniref:Glycosyltransferase involved in cell wall biosynthesis n=1 Tax=Gelidibacter algens TaxID=49280 RepID=A0A327SHI7_9FLAO|nr:glycosyltransferase family 4 protein [Gelidibacter algens]RAJ25217.1 glycosyltransferase involved in cell wall biosynthesis [Gelidibacter algens]
MTIGFLTPEYPHPNFSRSGGLGTSIKNLAKGLVTHGVKVTVFVVGQQKDADFNKEGIHLVSIAKQKHFAFNWYLERKRHQRIIQKHIDKQGIKLLEAPDWTGISAFMKFNIPLIIRLNGSDGYFCHLEGRKQKWKHRFLERTALKNADAIVSVSTFTGELTKEIFGLKTVIRTIHNGIDIDEFKPLNLNINQGQLLYFGTIIRKKGVLELAQIFNRVVVKLPQCSLLLIGKDVVDIFKNTSSLSLFEELLTPEAKKRLTYLEEVPYGEIKNYIAKAEVVLLPSFAEAFPMTWLETLAMEKPLISSNIGWANELMLNGVTGYTIDPKDHKLFSEKVIELLENRTLAKSFGKSGRQHVIENFSKNSVVLKSIEFYKSKISVDDKI